MPELPEVETTRRGIAPCVEGRKVAGLVVRQPKLRWEIPVRAMQKAFIGQRIDAVLRRGKYLLFKTEAGHALLHLGMSGSVRILEGALPAAEKHDHVDISFSGGVTLRLNDPRRFGALLWTTDEPNDHPLLASLGPEPLSDDFSGGLLHKRARGRRAAVKAFIMDAKTVVGVGNIYASEALFRAGIHPERAAGRLSKARFDRLAETIRHVLGEAIEQGGTTLRDFRQSDGELGYFAQKLAVYGKSGESCPQCKRPIEERRIGQRNSFFCPDCQT